MAADRIDASRRSFGVSDVPTLPRELIDAFVPPVTPSGRRLHRIPRSIAEPS